MLAFGCPRHLPSSAGSGALHSEQNASQIEPMRFIQIWILPDTPSSTPGVEQRVFTKEQRTDTLLKVLGPEGGDVVSVHQDAAAYIASLTSGTEVTHPSAPGRGIYGYLIEGASTFNDETVTTGDAAKVVDEDP